MKWRGTLLIWIGLLSVFSLYNVPANITQSVSTQRFVSTKIFHYNFSMTSSSMFNDTLALQFYLDKPPDSYLYFSYANISEQLNAVSALGEFVLNWTLIANGARVIGGSHSQVWVHTPYGLNDTGEIPDTGCCAKRDNFTAVQGENLALLHFTFSSNLSRYGNGYYSVVWGPLIVETQGKVISPLYGWAFEFLAGVFLVPVAHFLNLTVHNRWRRKRRK